MNSVILFYGKGYLRYKRPVSGSRPRPSPDSTSETHSRPLTQGNSVLISVSPSGPHRTEKRSNHIALVPEVSRKQAPPSFSFSLFLFVCFSFILQDTNLQVRSFNSSCLDLQRESVNLQEHLQVWGSCTNKCFLLSEQGSQ